MGKMIFIFLLALLNCTFSQTFLNLDFEEVVDGNEAIGWERGRTSYPVYADTTVSYNGKISLCIKADWPEEYGDVTAIFPVEDARGKTLKLSGYIKTKDVEHGYAGLWCRVDGPDDYFIAKNMQDYEIKGTKDWGKYSIELEVNKDAEIIRFGALLLGIGTAWFDNLTIELDGKLYEQKIPKLTPEENEWLKQNINVFKTTEPVEDDSDLSFLDDTIGDAKIVALGNGMYGAGEMYSMMSRIFKYLVKNKGFTVFIIDSEMSDIKKINDYILGESVDPKKVLDGLLFYDTYKNKEILNLIEWMRNYNQSGKGRIELWGLEMELHDSAINTVLNFLQKYDNALYDTAKVHYNKMTSFERERKMQRRLVSRDEHIPFYKDAVNIYKQIIAKHDFYYSVADKDTVDWFEQSAKLVVQNLERIVDEGKDGPELKFENIEWIINHTTENPKVLYISNNRLVSRENLFDWEPIGHYLSEQYGNKMVVIGTCFYKGKQASFDYYSIYNIENSEIPPNGSLEVLLHKLDIPLLFFDFRKLKDSQLKLFNKKLLFPHISYWFLGYNHNNKVITEQYDVLLYIDKVSPFEYWGTTEDNEP